MATGLGGERAINDQEWKQLQQFREQLFPCDWSGDQFKALIRDEVPSEVFSERTGFKLFLGNCDHAADLECLQQRKITYVLNMAAGEKSCQMNAEVYGDGFTCKRIAAEDNPDYDLSQHFVETAEFIDRVRRKRAAVLVHCAAGASRSATVVIAFLMQRLGWSLEKAAHHVHSRRARTYPNMGFLKQLIELDRETRHKGQTCRPS